MNRFYLRTKKQKIMNKHILEIKRLAKEFKCMGTYGLIELELTELEKQLESIEAVNKNDLLQRVSGSFSADDINEAYELGRKEEYNGSPMTGDEVATKWNNEEFKLKVRQVYI